MMPSLKSCRQYTDESFSEGGEAKAKARLNGHSDLLTPPLVNGSGGQHDYHDEFFSPPPTTQVHNEIQMAFFRFKPGPERTRRLKSSRKATAERKHSSDCEGDDLESQSHQ